MVSIGWRPLFYILCWSARCTTTTTTTTWSYMFIRWMLSFENGKEICFKFILIISSLDFMLLRVTEAFVWFFFFLLLFRFSSLFLLFFLVDNNPPLFDIYSFRFDFHHLLCFHIHSISQSLHTTKFSLCESKSTMKVYINISVFLFAKNGFN